MKWIQWIQKYCCYFFLQSAHFLGLFSSCHAYECFESMLCTLWTHLCYKGVCNILLGMLCEVTSAKHAVLYEVTSAKHAWVSLEKIWIGQMGKLEEKIARVLLYWLHSFPLACFNVSHTFTAPTCTTTIVSLEPCALNAEFQHFIPRFNRIFLLFRYWKGE